MLKTFLKVRVYNKQTFFSVALVEKTFLVMRSRDREFLLGVRDYVVMAPKAPCLRLCMPGSFVKVRENTRHFGEKIPKISAYFSFTAK